MVSTISSMNFATNDKMKQQELLNAENLLKKATGKDGTIDYTNKSQEEVNKINDATIVILSSKASEEEKASFSINIDSSNQLYNEKGLSSDVTDSALFRTAETKYASNLNAGIAADTMSANEELLSNLEQSIEEQAQEAQEEAATKLKEEKAQLQAERIENSANNTEQVNNTQEQSASSATQINTQQSSNTVESKSETSSQDNQSSSTATESVDTYV